MVIPTQIRSDMSDEDLLDYIKDLVNKELNDDIEDNLRVNNPFGMSETNTEGNNPCQYRWIYTCNIYNRNTDRLTSCVYYLTPDVCHRLHSTCGDRLQITYNIVNVLDRDYAVAFHNSNYRRICIAQGIMVV